VRPRNPPVTELIGKFDFDGQRYKGRVLDLYPTGLFLETDAAVERSTVLEIRLEDPASARVVVAESIVEQRVEPTALAPRQPRGLKLRLFHLSAEYSVLIGAMAPSAAAATAAPSERIERKIAERNWVTELDTGVGSTAPPRPHPPAHDRAASGSDRGEAPLQQRAGEPIFDEESPAPKAVLIDDGELDDVAAILQGLGVRVGRTTPAGDNSLPDWVAPTHLLVISAKRALSLGYSLDLGNAAFTGLVVTDSSTRTLHPIVHRLGYRFLVRRPVHPEALRTLMRQALHRDSGRRAAPRVAIGCRASFRPAGALRRREGTLVDLSPDSCQLLVADKISLGTRLQIRLPAASTGGRRIDLAGRVVRRGALDRERRALGIVFDELPKRMRDRVLRLMEELERGPARFDGRVEVDAPIGASVEPEASAPSAEDRDAPRPERRRSKRAAFRRELVALDAGSEAVRLSLIGCDLSVEGMRVEPNPELSVDDHLRLAFYDCDDGEPLLLHAVVTRNDGRRGSCLRFIGIDAESRARLERAIDELPSIESVEGDEPEGAWAAIGQVELVPQPLD
jgi:hypothetical protein